MATRNQVIDALNANGVIRKIELKPDESFIVETGPDAGTTVQVEVVTLLATNDEESSCQENNRRVYTISPGLPGEAAYVLGGIDIQVGQTPLQAAFKTFQGGLLSGNTRALEVSRNEEAGIVEYQLLALTSGTPNTYAVTNWIFWRRPETGATGQARKT